MLIVVMSYINLRFIFRFFLFIILFNNLNLVAQVLVIEPNTNEAHTGIVEWYACGDSDLSCLVFTDFQEFIYLENKNVEGNLYDSIFDKVRNSNVVNFSMELIPPTEITEIDIIRAAQNQGLSEEDVHEKYKLRLESYTFQVESITNLITDFQNKLFVVAAGNGLTINGLQTFSGIGLDKYESYPAHFEFDNLITVASYDRLEDKVASYSNYSLIHVDVALSIRSYANPKHPGLIGQPIKGTSFASPSIARVADQIMTANLNLDSQTLKKIFLRSCRIKDVDAATNASIDFITKNHTTGIFKALNHSIKAVRDDAKKTYYSDVDFVKCGGEFVKELAQRCVKYLNDGLSLDQACINAHSELGILKASEIAKLQNLWDLRGL